MASLTNANLRRDLSSARPGAGESVPLPTPSSPGIVSGELGDLAAQFNQRRYRPLGVSDLFDEAFDLYRSNFVLFLGAAAVILVPLNIAIYELVLPGLRASAGHVASSQFDPAALMDFLGEATSTSLSVMAAYCLFFVVLSGASIAIASNRYLGRPAQLGTAYKIALRRALPMLLCVAVALLTAAVGTALCFIPGLIVFCRLALLPQVVILEPTLNPFAALRRAWHLSSGHGSRIFGILLLLSIISSVILLSLQAPIALAIGLLPLDSIPFLSDIARNRNLSTDVTGVVANLLTTPFTFIALTALYYDLRIRDEGHDMAILAGLLGFGDPKQWLATALPHAGAPLRAALRVGAAPQQPSKQRGRKGKQ